MSKKNRTPETASVSPVETPEAIETATPSETAAVETSAVSVETPEKAEETPETFLPLTSGGKNTFGTKGPRDSFGYGSETVTSLFYRLLSEGKTTKDGIRAAIIEAYPATAGKSTVSVLFSDASKPFGKYPGSRGLGIRVSSKTGFLSFDPSEETKVKKAIEGGILSRLRGLSFGTSKYRNVLREFGLSDGTEE